MEELLAKIEAALANPEVSIEELQALLTEAQQMLLAAADGTQDVPADTVVAAAEKMQKLQGVIETKKAAQAVLNDIKTKAQKTVNQLPSPAIITTDDKARKQTKVFNSDRDALKSALYIAAAFKSDAAVRRLENEFGVKTLTSGNHASAGIFVPDEMDNEIIRLREQYGVARNFATIKNMTSETLTLLKAVSGNSAYFVNNGTEPTATDLVYRNLTLNARNLAVRTKYYANLSDDALISIADEITDWAARAIAIKEDQCFFNGDGTSTYGGMFGLTYVFRKLTEDNAGTWATDGDKDNCAGVALAAGATWASITDDNISSLMGKVADYPGADLGFHTTRQFYFEVLHNLALNAGGTTGTEVVNGVPRNVFYGYPVYFNNVMPKSSSNNQVCLLFGDTKLGAYMGDRRGITIETDKNIATQEHDVVVTSRFDINVHDYGNYNSTAASQTPGAFAALVTKNA